MTGATGSLAVDSGTLTANLVTGLGTFEGSLAVADYARQVIADLPNYSGTLTFAEGAIVVDLTTPTGEIARTIDYAQSLSTIAALVSGLNLG
jgi:hypothetical protein